jgi:hypothetical protein
MARNELRFSMTALIGLAFIGPLSSTLLVALAVDLGPRSRLGPLGVLRIFGDDAVRAVLFGFAVCGVLLGLAALRRAIAGEVAAAIRYDGIELKGVFFSRYIPWRCLEGIDLRTFRASGETNCFIRIRSHCPPGASALHHFCASLSYGVSEKVIAASGGEIRAWVEQARAAWAAAANPPPRLPRMTGFGRRAV